VLKSGRNSGRILKNSENSLRKGVFEGEFVGVGQFLPVGAVLDRNGGVFIDPAPVRKAIVDEVI